MQTNVRTPVQYNLGVTLQDFWDCSYSVCVSLSAGGPRLKCSEMLTHVTDVLQNSYTCSAYGEDCSSLLVKDILSVRKYWCDIPPQQWHSQWDCHLNYMLYINYIRIV